MGWTDRCTECRSKCGLVLCWYLFTGWPAVNVNGTADHTPMLRMAAMFPPPFA